MAFAGCSGDDVTELTQERNPGMVGTEVAFTTDMDLFTRATTGSIDNMEALKNLPEGFGVYAYLTEGSPFSAYAGEDGKYATAADFSAFSNFFMTNQQVTWAVQAVVNKVGVKDWVYTPLKYWPNGTAGTDDPLTNDGNTDITNNRRISFFAYAPYVEAAQTAGITNLIRAVDKSPHLWYTMGDEGSQTDLLWANCIDARRNQQGLIEVDKNQGAWTYQRVPLTFSHALAGVDIYVQRIYDEQAFAGNTPEAATGNDDVTYTKLFISELQLEATGPGASPVFGSKGRLNLFDGSWSGVEGRTGNADKDKLLTFSESVIEEKLRGTQKAVYIEEELDKWGRADFGVDERERRLLRPDAHLMLIPQMVTFVPRVTYSMVTRDDALEKNTDYAVTETVNGEEVTHYYSRIVNTMNANPVTVTFEAGKKYTLLLRIGVEHISFEVVSVVDWDFPMRFDPQDVPGFTGETISHRLDEALD